MENIAFFRVRLSISIDGARLIRFAHSLHKNYAKSVYFVTELICIFDEIIWVNDSVAIRQPLASKRIKRFEWMSQWITY